ncbi:N-acyl-D-amino-acid deacylase family protein [Amycolatopsis jejuensis]|uniref:N-acyl-D-amino-acid deacylase family protein n=1 Tax=Amycolatopsis jejuensis TaxID=330084 RepID=UPI0005255D3E|nr:D-aminoacylase [Amycolatopsis jejuensis]
MSFSLVVRAGIVVDGTGAPPFSADVAIDGDRIVRVGTVPEGDGPELRADGCVVAPGFVNVLSHAYYSLQQDPRGLSDLYQGVTTEVFGEGHSPGPVSGRLPAVLDGRPVAAGVRTGWHRLRDFLTHLESTGVGPNVASFVGAENLRAIHAGADRRALTEDELAKACALLDDELSDGALGLGSALIYAPGSYASTEELEAYARVLASHDALYISHIRDEGDRILDAAGELVGIARRTGVRAEVYHLKVTGRANWPLMPAAVKLIEEARAEGLQVTADVYPYEAGCTDLAACIPPKFHSGGMAELLSRLADPASRREIRAAIAAPAADWQNLYRDSDGAEGIALLGSAHQGATLAEVHERRGGGDPIETLLDLVVEEPGLLAAYFAISEPNIRLALAQPWVSVGSDADAPSAVPPFTDAPTHPRAYGTFARVLGHYVRAGVLSLEEAVRRMTSLPAHHLRLTDRGQVREGAFADLAIFRPEEVRDLATYENPHAYAAGMRHVLVNGVIAFADGKPTGELAGRALRRGR